jgi:signal transduction histidine kinase
VPRNAREETVFVFAPTGRDSRLIADMLAQAQVKVQVCRTTEDLFSALQSGAAAAIVAEEGLSRDALSDLTRLLGEQPFWSDLPIIFLTFAGRPSVLNIASAQSAGELGNVTLLERPIRPETLRLAVRAAIRTRMRQYQLRTRQESLQQAISELEQFAYSASHDLREPLRNISIFTELLENQYKEALDDVGREYCGFVRAGAKRMEGLVEDLLNYTRLGDDDRQEPASSDAAKCLQMALASLTQSIAESRAVVEAGELPTVAMKSTHLYQIFQNLIGNAIKYRREENPLVRILATKDAGFGWKFAVEDNGIGIRPEYQERIFGLFKRLHNTSQYAGSGIGLAICQRIVQRYGGRIWVDSQPGQGSTFFFTVKG